MDQHLFKVSSEETRATHKDVVFYRSVPNCFSLTWNSIKSSVLGVNYPVKYEPFPTNSLLRKFSVNGQVLWIFGQIIRDSEKLPIYKKFPLQEVRWKILYCTRWTVPYSKTFLIRILETFRCERYFFSFFFKFRIISTGKLSSCLYCFFVFENLHS